MPEHITQSVLAKIVEIAADAIICMDANQRITFFNSGAETIFGWSTDEIVGQRIEVLIPERYRAHHEVQVHGFGRSGVKARRMGERREIAGLRRNGDEFPAEAAISQINHDDLIVYAVVLRDVTARHRFERRQSFLAEAGERLAATVESGDTLRHVVSLAVPALADGCVIETRENDGYRTAATRHREQSVDDLLTQMRHGGVRAFSEDHPLSLIFRNGKSELLETEATQRLLSLSPNPGEVLGIRALNAGSAVFIPMVARGEMIAVLSLYRSRENGFDAEDIALAEDFSRLAALAIDNARLHDTLSHSLRSRDEMIGIVSHDLGNPVAAVKMLSRAIMNNATSAEHWPGLESVALMSQAADQMDSLIRDLLDVSRLDSANLRIQPEHTDPVQLMHDSLQTLLPLALAKNIELENAITGDFPEVSADMDRVQQVLSNLVGNALKFTPAGGRIVVSADRRDNELVVSVQDNGRGIAAGQLPHVFERYWQSSRTERHGTGLGLPIAKGIVEAHGGKIWIESVFGEGTCVSFTLRLAASRS